MTTCLQCGHADPAEFLYCPRCGTKAVAGGTLTDPLLGRILNGKYRIEIEIGQGAMGTVYLGEHIGLKKKIALKVLHKDLQVSDESLQRFQREGIAAGKFNHPHLIQIFDFDRSESGSGERLFYLAMEYVEGDNLTLFLRQRGRLPIETALKLARQMLSCLAEAHRHGIVHRDLKPDNIMVSEFSRGELRVKVLDFGLSKLVDRRLDSSLTQPGRILGTPLYMAPEQVVGEEADQRSDVYAAGLILYEMLAGERPFREKDATQLFLTRPTAEAPSLRANVPDLAVPDELEALLVRALGRERAKRFQTAEEMLNALDEVPLDAAAARSSAGASAARTRTVPAPATSAAASTEGPATRGRRRVATPLVIGLLAVVLVVGATILTVRGSGAASRPARVRMIAAEKRNDQQQRYVGLLDEARLKLHGGDSQAALTAVNQASLLDCRDAEVFLIRAEIYRSRGDLVSAVTEFDTAAAAEPRSAEPHLGKCWIQLDLEHLGEAEASVARAETLDPESAAVLAARGALVLFEGKRDEARALLQRAIAQDGSSAPGHLYLGRLRLEEGDAEGAIAALVEAKSKDPFWVMPLVLLADAYEAQGRTDLADAQLGEALRLEPGSAELRVRRGSILLERGRGGDALEFLRESTEHAPHEGRLWILRGIAALESGDVAGAIEALRRGFEQGARDPEARCLLGALYQQEGKLDEAVVQYETVLREEGEYPCANLELGLALVAQGKYLEARERFERVLAFDDENLAAHLALGQLFRNILYDEDQAIAHLERYQALGGDDPRLAEWLDELR